MNKLLIFLFSLLTVSLEAAVITNWGTQLPNAVPTGSDVILMQQGGVTRHFTPSQLASNLSTNVVLIVGASNALYPLIVANDIITSNGVVALIGSGGSATNAIGNLNGIGTNATFYMAINMGTSNSVDVGSFLSPARTNWVNDLVAVNSISGNGRGITNAEQWSAQHIFWAGIAQTNGININYAEITNQWQYFKTNTVANSPWASVTVSNIGFGSGLPIFSYTFTPREFDHTVIIGAGWHGLEMSSATALWRFFYHAANGQGGNAFRVMDTTRYVVMPWVNPYGRNNGTYTNAAGVDINANFPYQWSISTDPNKGASALSESETLAVYGVMTNAAYANKTAFLALHDYVGSTNTDMTGFMPHAALEYDAEPLFRVISYFAGQLTNTWRMYDARFGTPINTAVQLGMTAFVAEHAIRADLANFPYLSAGDITHAVEWIGNLILSYSRVNRPSIQKVSSLFVDRLNVGFQNQITNDTYRFLVKTEDNLILAVLNDGNTVGIGAYDFAGSVVPMTIKSSRTVLGLGNVGVLATNPITALHVFTGGETVQTRNLSPEVGDGIFLESNPNSATNTDAYINFWAKPTVADNGTTYGAARIRSGWELEGALNWNKGYLAFQTHHLDAADWYNSMIIKAGNVGLGGVTNPVDMLTVWDGDKTPLTLYSDANVSILSTNPVGIDRGGSLSLGGGGRRSGSG